MIFIFGANHHQHGKKEFQCMFGFVVTRIDSVKLILEKVVYEQKI
jgi:hypothetical protein